MSLILVVDPDSRHAAKVASMARKHLKAEFVTADSGFRALEVLADRVPDVVLTAPLLPHRDEAVLSDYLRALGDAGAHVQTLTIPILSAGATIPRAVRGRFKRERATSAPDGCDPELFAQQVHQYLQRAHETRRPGPAEDPAVDADAQDTAELDDSRDIDLTPFLSELAEPAEPPSAPAPPQAPSAITLSRAPAPVPASVIEAEIVDAPDPPRLRDRDRSAESDLQVRGADAAAVPTHHLITLPAMLGDAASGRTQTSVNVAVAVSVHVAAQTTPAAPASKKRATPKPLQDEWGFFDPDQCGFRALLARLDAIAGTEESDSD